MKYLNTDKQTMIDIGVYDTMYGEQMLFDIFRDTDTRKGKVMLQHWITNPLRCIDQIKERQHAIAWEHLPELPLAEEELDFLEYYLDYREQLSYKGTFLSFINKVDRLFKPDPSRYIIRRGVGLAVKLLARLYSFRDILPQILPTLINKYLETINYSFEFEDLAETPHLYGGAIAISDYMIDRLDYLFRQERLDIIRGLLDVVYELDVLRSVRKVAIERNYCCCPIMTEDGDLSITGFLHPFISDGQTNDWAMRNGNISIFTGSNMAGKSTTLKALSSIIWLAHCGLPVPVASMTCPVYDGFYTSINLPDSLRDGRSHFMAEVLRIKEVLRQIQSGKRCLVVLDEMFRGTNAQDAFEASVAVNGLLKQYAHSHFLISTHIIEFAKHFEADPSCCFYYMQSEIVDNNFICSYQLKSGISESRVGYWLVQKELCCGHA